MKPEPTKEIGAIEEFKDWQAHQYTPGYYIGGNTHPVYRRPTRGLGYIMLLSAIICLTVLGFQVATGDLRWSSAPSLLLFIVFLVGGIRTFQRL